MSTTAQNAISAWTLRRALDGDTDNERYVREAVRAADGREPDADVHISAATLTRALDGDIDHINYVHEALDGYADDVDVGVFPD